MALVGHWLLDETSGTVATDSSGNANNGTLTNGPTRVVDGPFTNATQFDGVNDYVDISHSTALNIGGTALTIAAWWKFDTTGDWQCLVTKPAATGAHTDPYFLWMLGSHNSNNTPRFSISTGFVLYSVFGSGAMTPGTWYHLCGVYNGTNLRIFLDGVLAGTTTQGGSIMQATSPLRISGHATGGEVCKGTVSDVRVYDSVLSEAEITALYELGFASGGTVPAVALVGRPAALGTGIR